MLPAALEQERLFVAERLLSEIERRHGLPHPTPREIPPVIIERFLTAYLPETRDGEPAPLALEYAFSPTISEALDLMKEVVTETSSGFGAAVYIHDLDTGISYGLTSLERPSSTVWRADAVSQPRSTALFNRLLLA